MYSLLSVFYIETCKRTVFIINASSFHRLLLCLLIKQFVPSVETLFVTFMQWRLFVRVILKLRHYSPYTSQSVCLKTWSRECSSFYLLCTNVACRRNTQNLFRRGHKQKICDFKSSSHEWSPPYGFYSKFPLLIEWLERILQITILICQILWYNFESIWMDLETMLKFVSLV